MSASLPAPLAPLHFPPLVAFLLSCLLAFLSLFCLQRELLVLPACTALCTLEANDSCNPGSALMLSRACPLSRTLAVALASTRVLMQLACRRGVANGMGRRRHFHRNMDVSIRLWGAILPILF